MAGKFERPGQRAAERDRRRLGDWRGRRGEQRDPEGRDQRLRDRPLLPLKSEHLAPSFANSAKD